jgi:ADP-ribose pyrophosphatase YjhB (NUDIX family)
VYRSLPRVVAEGIIRQGREVLLVKASRGLTKGLWSLPGGFLQFGEAPEQTLKRELEEELGVEARVGPLVAVRAKVGPHSGLHWLFFFYQAHIAGPPRPNPDEISEVRFAPLPEAARLVADETMGGVLEELSRR